MRQSRIILAVLTMVLFTAPDPFVFAQGFGEQEQAEIAAADLALATPVIREFGYGELEAMPVDELRALYDAEIDSMREVTKQLRREGTRYFHVDSDQAFFHAKKWKEWADKGLKGNRRIKEISLVLFLKTEEVDMDLATVAAFMCQQSFKEGRLGICYRVTQKLRTVFPEQQELIDDEVRLAAYNNEYTLAADYVAKNAAKIAGWPMFEQALLDGFEKKQADWEAELAIRAKEEAADDLPRVEILTSKGKIVIELFENEAPHTVGNFISLVEKGFYNDLLFHLVVRNYRAHGGIFLKDRYRDTGYKIYDESVEPNARRIFRGSVSMISSKAAKGSSEFFINTSPEPVQDFGDPAIVFGRVIEGIEVVESLNVTAKIGTSGRPEILKEARPDHIISARVVRKRPGSNYVPKILENE